MKNLYTGLENFREIVKTEELNIGSLIELYGNLKVLEYRANETIEKHNDNCKDENFLPHDLVYFIQDLESNVREMIKEK